jgi:DNA-binding MarR family transcriptional regulator
VIEKYFDIVMTIERLHRLFLDVVKSELDRLHIMDISNVQAMILFNVGKNKMTVGEVSNRGYYLGSNVTYNLKKMVENGYLEQEQAVHDRRSSVIKLSAKGAALYDQLEQMLNRHMTNLPRNNVSSQDLDAMVRIMENLETFWSFMMARDLRM